jgi:hypothetical protein
MTVRPYKHSAPPRTVSSFSDVNAYLRDMFDTVFRLRQGKMDCIAELTLTANSATTVLNDVRLSVQSVVTFDPKTLNAATEIHGGTMYVLTANRASKVWTITHANNAQADRSFQVSIIG